MGNTDIKQIEKALERIYNERAVSNTDYEASRKLFADRLKKKLFRETTGTLRWWRFSPIIAVSVLFAVGIFVRSNSIITIQSDTPDVQIESTLSELQNAVNDLESIEAQFYSLEAEFDYVLAL